MSTVRRTIHFYRLIPFNKKSDPPNRTAIHNAISSIDPNLQSSRYTSAPGEELCVWNDTPSPFHSKNFVKFAIGKIRTRNIPGTVVSGLRKNLQAANVLELCHCVMFRSHVIGAEWNHYGPRVGSQLHRYFANKFENVLEPFILKPLFDIDIVETLNRFTQLKGMTLKIEREKIRLINNDDDRISSALENIGRPYPIADLQVAINLPPADKLQGGKEDKEKQKARRSEQEAAFSHQLFDEVVSIIKETDVVNALEAFSVRGFDRRTKQVETINLLERRISTRKNVRLIDDRHGMVDSESMYSSIEEAYDELSESINSSVAAGFKIE